ncbi:retrotransposon protein [Hordeum vulgare]|nr:retrotransposon protein [Hordeum vulgare]
MFGERALPLLKLMKRLGPFAWTTKADAAFANLKWYLTSPPPPIMVAPQPRELLLLYLVATAHMASAALVMELEGPTRPKKLSAATRQAQQELARALSGTSTGAPREAALTPRSVPSQKASLPLRGASPQETA